MLTRSKDRKVANAVSPNGKTATIANAFGLPSGKNFSCPDQTDFCASICYAGKLEKIYKGVSAVLLRNWDALKDASLADMVTMLAAMIAEFVKDCDKRDAKKLFRIHWDGDFFNATYVAAWSRVIADFPDVQFWAYTRVQTAAVFLHTRKHDNLALYFSADPDNVAVAKYLETRGIRIAYVGRTFADGKAEFANATRCPENNKAMPLISEQGSACARCGLCVFGRKNVLFSSSKK
jgi:hypothetical protein